MDMNNTRYIPPHCHEGKKSNMEIQRIKEGKCKCYGKKWDPKHRCDKGKESNNLYRFEATHLNLFH